MSDETTQVSVHVVIEGCGNMDVIIREAQILPRMHVDTLRKLDGSGNNHLLLSVIMTRYLLHCVKEINHTCMHVYCGMPILN